MKPKVTTADMCIIVGVVGLTLLLVISMKALGVHNDPTATPVATSSPVNTSSTPRTQVASKDPPNVIAERAALNERVKTFSKLYFSRSPAVSPEKAKELVRPYVTTSFLRRAQFGFGTSDTDKAMIREGASIETEAISDFNAEGFRPNMRQRLSGTIELVAVKVSREGHMVVTFQRTQEITVVKQNGLWYIDDAPAT